MSENSLLGAGFAIFLYIVIWAGQKLFRQKRDEMLKDSIRDSGFLNSPFAQSVIRISSVLVILLILAYIAIYAAATENEFWGSFMFTFIIFYIFVARFLPLILLPERWTKPKE